MWALLWCFSVLAVAPALPQFFQTQGSFSFQRPTRQDVDVKVYEFADPFQSEYVRMPSVSSVSDRVFSGAEPLNSRFGSLAPSNLGFGGGQPSNQGFVGSASSNLGFSGRQSSNLRYGSSGQPSTGYNTLQQGGGSYGGGFNSIPNQNFGAKNAPVFEFFNPSGVGITLPG